MRKTKIEMCRQLYKIGFVLLILAVLPMLSFAKDSPEREQHFTKEFEVNANTLLKLNGYDHPVTIEHWYENRIFVDVTVNARGDEDQIDEFMKAIELEMEMKGNTVTVKTEMNVSCTVSIVGNKRMKTKGSGWIKLEDYTIDVHIKMPAQNSIDAELSYCDLNILGDVKGDFKLKNYEARTTVGDILGEADIELTYGDFEAGKIPNPKRIHLYELDFTCGDLGACTFESRYSKVNLKSAGVLCMKSYEDKIYFDRAESLTGTYTYSYLEGNRIDVMEAKLYESKVIVKNIESLKVDSKYTKFELENCKALTLIESYEGKFEIGELVVLSGPVSKYDVFNITQLSGALFLDGYESKVNIQELSNEVTGFILKGNYMKADLAVDPMLYFDLEMNLTYPNVDFPENEFSAFAKEKDNKLNAFLETKHENPNDVKFTFEGYEMNVDLFRK